MKKSILFLLTLVMILCFTACGGRQDQTASEPEVTTIEVEDVVAEKGGFLEYTYSEHKLNDKGQVVSRKVSGDSNHVDTFEYDSEGRVVKNIRTSRYGEEIYTYKYDENGLLIEEFQGDRTFINTYTFDENGRVLTKTSVNADPSADYTIVYSYTYNPDGTVATETQTSDNSVWVLTFTYDEKGRVITQEAVKQNGDGRSTTIYTYAVVGSYTPAS